ncbi:glycosyltransferase [Pedobacter sp. MC2016-24]|uniref:glycosyltransferase n=1 Tax=Pedobacter sp. MC2016-24 TaxID=2780090 RepID=UPI00188201A6|nr:glycosyltransferase [Pedobacter sp. MC2016-24]MBE9600320.1 glycosyltransferase [Pedobacter sp. MC2016-24]
MKKVLIISLGRNGGLPNYASSIIKELEGVEYDVLISKQATANYGLDHTIVMSTYSGILSFLFRTLFYLPFKFMMLLPKMCREYNTLYLPYNHFWALPFMILFRILGRKVVITIHDGILHEGENNKWLQLDSDLKIKLATDVIFLTVFVKNQVINRMKANKRLHIIPHGIYENEFVTIKEQHLSKNILFVGRIGKYKGVELLIDAASDILPDFDQLIIAGKSLYPIVNRSTSESIKIKDKFLTDEEIGALLSWADILVIPYLEATQSGVITLGIYAELPMVCTKVGGLQEQLKSDECIWVEPNKESLKTGLLSLLNDKDLFWSLKHKMALKKKEFSWNEVSKLITQVFK